MSAFLEQFQIRQAGGLMFLAAALSFLLARAAWAQRKKLDSAGELFFVLLSAGIWSFGYGLEIFTSAPEILHASLVLGYVGIVAIPVFWVLFAARYCGQDHWINRGRVALLFVIPALTLTLVTTSPLHPAYYRHMEIREIQGYTYYALEWGPFFWLHIVYSHMLVLTGVAWLTLLTFRVGSALERRRLYCLLAGSIIPYIANTLYIAGFRPFGFLDLTPIAFVFMGVFFTYGVFNLGLFKVFPLALDLLFEQLPDPLWILDPEGNILNANPAARGLMEQGLQSPLKGYILKDSLFGGTKKILFFQARSYTIREQAILDKRGGQKGTLVILRDITQEKQAAENLRRSHAALEASLRESKELARQAQAATEAKSVFLATMSHEIRTPLNGILSTAELLRQGAPDDEQRRYADLLISSGSSLLHLINRVLDFSKLEAGKLELHPRDFDPAALCNEVIDSFRAPALEKNLELSFDCAPEVPGRINLDSDLLRQILYNLLGNAIKFTARGSVRLEVLREPDAENILRFRVIDTGIGVAPEKQSLIFEQFVQADGSSTRRFGGTGLGLSICKHQIEHMGGSIHLESIPEQGSVFWFTLPHLPAGKEPVVQVPHTEQIRILLVEDNSTNRLVAGVLLSKLGIPHDEAEDGGIAIQKATAQKFDLILMDLEMPEVDGYAATRAIRAFENTATPADVPIIALSAHAEWDVLAACKLSGVTDFLSKPFLPHQLVAIMEKWLGGPLSEFQRS